MPHHKLNYFLILSLIIFNDQNVFPNSLSLSSLLPADMIDLANNRVTFALLLFYFLAIALSFFSLLGGLMLVEKRGKWRRRGRETKPGWKEKREGEEGERGREGEGVGKDILIIKSYK